MQPGAALFLLAPLALAQAPRLEARHLNLPVPAGRTITGFTAAPSGRWVVYTDGKDIYSARTSGPESTVVLSPEVPGPFDFVLPRVLFTPDSSRVIFSWFDADFGATLYMAPVDGSSPPVALDSASTGGNPAGFQDLTFTPDGSRLVYILGASSYSTVSSVLRSLPLDGSTGPISYVGLSDPGSATVQLAGISADGTRVLGATTTDYTGFNSFRSYLLDGTPGTQDLLPANGQWGGHPQLDSTGQRVVFSCAVGTESELWSSLVDGSAPPILLASPYVSSSGGHARHAVSPVTASAAWFERRGSTMVLLYGPTDGSAPGTELVTVPVGKDLRSLQFDPSGEHVLWMTNAGGGGQYQIRSVRVDGSTPWATVNGPLVAGGSVQRYFTSYPELPRSDFLISPDGSTVVYRANAAEATTTELWAAPVAGGGTARRLHHPLATSSSVGRDFSLLGDSVIFSGPPFAGVLPNWQTRLAEPGPWFLRSPVTHTVLEAALTPNGSHVVWLADDPVTPQLWSFPLPRERAASLP